MVSYGHPSMMVAQGAPGTGEEGTMQQVGKWAFILGLVIAAIGGLGLQQTWFTWVLAVLGLIVGFLNVQETETQGFLLPAIGLMLGASALNSLPLVGGVATYILDNLVAFISAAVLVVAIRSLFVVAKD